MKHKKTRLLLGVFLFVFILSISKSNLESADLVMISEVATLTDSVYPPQISALLLYSQFNQTLSANTSTDITVNVGGHSILDSFLGFSDLTASAIQVTVEDAQPSNGSISVKPLSFMSFTIPNDAYLVNFSFYAFIQNAQGLEWRVYNASWDPVDGETPHAPLNSTINYVIGDGTTKWYGAEQTNITLQSTLTINNTFFLEFDVPTNADWHYVYDNLTHGDGEDGGQAFSGNLPSTLMDWDFLLKDITLIPVDTSPTPTDIGMTVNGTAVNAQGEWEDTSFYANRSTVFFDVNAYWPLDFQVTVILNTSKNQLRATHYALRPNGILWNVTVNSTLLPVYSNSNFTFQHPSDWIFTGLYNYSLSSTNNISSSTFEKIYWGKGNANWTLTYLSPNYLSIISVLPYPNATINDPVEVSAKFNDTVTPTMHNGTLEIRNSTGDLVYSTEQPREGRYLNFTWIPSSSITSAGNYSLRVIWHNITELGLVETTVNLNYNTIIESSYTEQTEHSIGQDALIVINFKNEVLNANISNAVITGSWAYNSSLKFIEIDTGVYQTTFNTTDSLPGIYPISFNATKNWHAPSNLIVNLQLVVPTDYLMEGQTTKAFGDLFQFTFTYQNLLNSSEIENWSLSHNSTGSVAVVNDTAFELTIDTTDYSAQGYVLSLGFNKSLFETLQFNIPITITKGTFDVQYNSTVRRFEGENIDLRTQIRNSISNELVSGVQITLTLLTVEYDWIELTAGNFRSAFSLPTTTGTFDATLTIQDPNYNTAQYTIQFTILDKATTQLDLQAPTDATGGDAITLTFALHYQNGTPIPNANIEIQFTFSYEEGQDSVDNELVTTNASGIALYNLEVPLAATQVVITARYDGTVATLSDTDAASVSVLPVSTGLDPMILVIIGVVIAIVVVSIIIVNQRRQQIEQKGLDKERIQTIYNDLVNIRHLFVIQANSGLTMYYKPYGEKPMQADLISGFLSALQNFAVEVGDSEIGVSEHNYRGANILIAQSELLRLAFFSTKPLSSDFQTVALENVSALSQDYRYEIGLWQGKITEGKEIGIKVEERFALPSIYSPLSMQECPDLEDPEKNSLCQTLYEQLKLKPMTVREVVDELGEPYLNLILSLMEEGIIQVQPPLNNGTNDVQTGSNNDITL